MNIWAVANQKGGVGKTTTSVTLGGLLAARGERTLLVDLDPQGSMTSYFGYDPDALLASNYQLFQRQAPSALGLVKDTGIAQLSLLPASTALATLDRQLGREEGKGLVMKRALASVSGQFEHVFIDCPPVLGVLMVNALAACQHLLIPVQTEFMALKGLERILRTIDMVGRALNIELPYTIVPTMFDRRTRAALESLRLLHQDYPEHMWDGIVPVDTQFRDASQMRVPLSVLNPRARGTLAYGELLQQLLPGNPVQPPVEEAVS